MIKQVSGLMVDTPLYPEYKLLKTISFGHETSIFSSWIEIERDSKLYYVPYINHYRFFTKEYIDEFLKECKKIQELFIPDDVTLTKEEYEQWQ